MAVETLFLIPAYNAASTLGQVLDSLLSHRAQAGLAEVSAVLVVDDGSVDGTHEIAEARGVAVERHSKNRGKGAALRRGLAWADERGIPKVVSLDADGQHPPSEAVRLARHPAPEHALLVGTRDLRAAGAPRPNQLSNSFSNLVLSAFAGQRLEDTQSGLRRYPAHATLALGSKAEGFAFESDVLLRAARRGLQIVHIPTTVLYPATRTSHFQIAKDAPRIVLSVVKTALTTPFQRSRSKGNRLLSVAPLTILLSPSEQPPALVEAILKACSEAASPRVCEIAPSPDKATVEITWQSDFVSASVRFPRSTEGRPAEIRTISFVKEDPPVERFRAVGYAVGTWGSDEASDPLAVKDAAQGPQSSEMQSGPIPPPKTGPPAATLAKEQPRTVRTPEERRNDTPGSPAKFAPRWVIDVSADLGTSYDNEARFGPSLGIMAQNLLGPLSASVRGSFLFVPSWVTNLATFSGHFWSIGPSLGVSTTQGDWALSAEIGPFVEEASLGGPGLIHSSRFQGGGRGTLALRRALSAHLQVHAGMEIGFRAGTTTVNVDGEPALTLSPLFATLRLGVSIPLGPKP